MVVCKFVYGVDGGAMWLAHVIIRQNSICSFYFLYFYYFKPFVIPRHPTSGGCGFEKSFFPFVRFTFCFVFFIFFTLFSIIYNIYAHYIDFYIRSLSRARSFHFTVNIMIGLTKLQIHKT